MPLDDPTRRLLTLLLQKSPNVVPTEEDLNFIRGARDDEQGTDHFLDEMEAGLRESLGDGLLVKDDGTNDEGRLLTIRMIGAIEMVRAERATPQPTSRSSP